MGWLSTRCTEGRGRERVPRQPPRALVVALALLAPSVAFAHERWVPNKLRFPVNHAYFQSMTGEVLVFSLLAVGAVFSMIVLWYVSAPPILEALSPSAGAAAGGLRGAIRALVRVALDGEATGPFMRHGLTVATFVFGRIPAFVLGLGAYQSWLVMPSFPLEGALALPLRITSAVLAVWVLSGVLWPVLGGVMLLVFVYLCFAYGVAAIDAIPVLASAFFYLFSKKGQQFEVNARQLLGIRLSLGVGFFLLGLVNKIYMHDLFIGVGDQHPDIVAGPQALIPGLTREAWSFTTALGEMVFGLLLLIGIFNRITTLALTYVFTNFIFIFGLDEIVHVYPVAGFLLLFFRGSQGTSLDGIVFRTTVGLWRRIRTRRVASIQRTAVLGIAGASAAFLFFTPLVLATEVVPRLTGDAVPANYKPPPLPPPASAWGSPSAAPSSAPIASAATPHADHRPRHGGVVTMSGDDHVEIVVRRDGGIALFVTDAVRNPIPLSETSGSVRLDGPGQKRTLPLAPDATAGALVAKGPPPATKVDYTYALQIRGKAASQTLGVPPGGTDGMMHQ